MNINAKKKTKRSFFFNNFNNLEDSGLKKVGKEKRL